MKRIIAIAAMVTLLLFVGFGMAHAQTLQDDTSAEMQLEVTGFYSITFSLATIPFGSVQLADTTVTATATSPVCTVVALGSTASWGVYYSADLLEADSDATKTIQVQLSRDGSITAYTGPDSQAVPNSVPAYTDLPERDAGAPEDGLLVFSAPADNSRGVHEYTPAAADLRVQIAPTDDVIADDYSGFLYADLVSGI